MFRQGGRVCTAGANIDAGKIVFLTSLKVFPGGNIEIMNDLHCPPFLSNLIKFYQIGRERWSGLYRHNLIKMIWFCRRLCANSQLSTQSPHFRLKRLAYFFNFFNRFNGDCTIFETTILCEGFFDAYDHQDQNALEELLPWSENVAPGMCYQDKTILVKF
jgi:hypothetical protein